MLKISPSSIKGLIVSRSKELMSQRLLQDKLSLFILLPALFINAATLLLLVIKVHPSDVAVPVRYSSLVGFDGLGPWYQIYYIGLFGLAVTLVNASLALVSFSRSRITSFFLLIGAFVVGLFCLVISAAFAAIV